MADIFTGIRQLFSGPNQVEGGDSNTATLASPPIEALSSLPDDEKLLTLLAQWKKEWDGSDVKKTFDEKSKEAEEYWLGQHAALKATNERTLIDNAIFEALETALPMMTRRNPEPNVEPQAEFSEDPNALEFAEDVEKKLIDIADIMKLRLKLKKATRHWAIYKLGALKIGWDLERDMPSVRVVLPSKLILDPKGTMDEDGYTGARIGEIREMEASILKKLVDSNKDEIDKITNKLGGTKVRFIEWWTPDYTCWQLMGGGVILMKKENPYWNRPQTRQVPQVDEMGNQIGVTNEEIPATNHFPAPRIPYVFLSIFNLGKQPIDDTSLIEQNLSQQDKLNKRNKQIDQNADNMNGGLVVSLSRAGLTKDEAAQVSRALRNGGVVAIPDGTPSDAIEKFTPTGLPADVYNDLIDTRQRIRDVFGTSGSTPAGISDEKTVRGKILNRGLDQDRIGGGITEYIEQAADDVYNWLVQLQYVFMFPMGYKAQVPGPDGQMMEQTLPLPKLRVSVSEGSMLPKDNVSLANQAMELAQNQLLDPITLYERLEFPNPKETAKQLWLWTNAPQMLFQEDPMIQQVIADQQAQAMAEAQMKQGPPGKVETGRPPSEDIVNQVPMT